MIENSILFLYNKGKQRALNITLRYGTKNYKKNQKAMIRKNNYVLHKYDRF